MAKIVPTFRKMFAEGRIPLKGGVWIDIYNQTTNERVSGTILARIDRCNYYYVTELLEQ